MELFVIKFNDFQSLTNATKNSIFNVTELVLGILIDSNTFFYYCLKDFQSIAILDCFSVLDRMLMLQRPNETRSSYTPV